MTELAKLFINSNISLTIHSGSSGKYYNLNNINYDIHFPIEWALDDELYYCEEDKKSYMCGPVKCMNCKTNGYYNGVFIGYCCSCAKLLNYERGNGMIYNGIEVNDINCNSLYIDSINIKKENSVWNNYLKDVKLTEIGDELLDLTRNNEMTKKQIKTIYENQLSDYDSSSEYGGDMDYYLSEDDSSGYEEDSSDDEFMPPLILLEPKEERESVENVKDTSNNIIYNFLGKYLTSSYK
jgi:hypothetical protein